jgi:transposase
MGERQDGQERGRGMYQAEVRQRAVRLVAETTKDHPSEWAAMRAVAAKLGVGSTETVRLWVRAAEAAEARSAAEKAVELKQLRAEVRDLRRTNEILKAAAGLFAAELHRPPHRTR